MRTSSNKLAPTVSGESGQASVEYAVVLAGVLALIIAFGALHAFLEDGQLITHALRSSSHAVENVHFDNIADAMSV